VDVEGRNLLLTDEIRLNFHKGRAPAIDDRQYVYRVYAPQDALPADLFRDAWHTHDESTFPRAWDLFDAALIRRVG
jgi:hypothetical protein